jgi:protein-S-isoprenylcysteine O-methyltransferase Ste14
MDQATSLAILLLTVAARELAEAALRRGGPSRGVGKGSVVVWYVAYSAILALALARAWLEPWTSLPLAGLALLWGGILLRLRSLGEIGRFYDHFIAIKDGHRLVVSGPYRWLRHPLHLGLHVEMAGLAWLAGSPLGWAVFCLSLVVLVRRNLEEERILERHFGCAYRAYRRRAWDVIDWLPASLRT